MNYTFEEHLKDKYETGVLWWPCKWYIQPNALSWGEWEKNEEFFKKNYPVQFFIRSTLPLWYHIKIAQPISECKYNVKGWIKNPRKEMRDKIFPVRWKDLTETIVDFHIETILEFVQKEKCFEYNDYTHTDEYKKFEVELKEWYYYVYVKRPAMMNSIDDLYHKSKDYSGFNETYKEVKKIEDNINLNDTNLCNWVIKNRDMFWV